MPSTLNKQKNPLIPNFFIINFDGSSVDLQSQA